MFDEACSVMGFDVVGDVAPANCDCVGSKAWWGCGAAGGRGATEAGRSDDMLFGDVW